MAIQKHKVTLQAALRGQFEKSETDLKAELESDLIGLFRELSGRELVEAVIVRLQRYAVEKENRSADSDFEDVGVNEMKWIRETIQEEFPRWVSGLISDEHREFVVRCHAQGISTTDAVLELMMGDAVIHRLAQNDAMGVESLQKTLVHRLSYLKPGTARWPEKKYGSMWREAREQYKREVSDIALTSPVEQVALLAKHAERINAVLENGSYSVKDLQILTNSLTKTLESLKKVSVVEEPSSPQLSAPQLVAVLERLTLALDAPEQLVIGGDAGALVSVLEQLALALKTSGQKALGDGTETSGQEAEVVSTEGVEDSDDSG